MCGCGLKEGHLQVQLKTYPENACTKKYLYISHTPCHTYLAGEEQIERKMRKLGMLLAGGTKNVRHGSGKKKKQSLAAVAPSAAGLCAIGVTNVSENAAVLSIYMAHTGGNCEEKREKPGRQVRVCDYW